MTLRLHPCAKVNLTLEVLSKRDDGYHEVVTILQTIDLVDDLTFEPASDLVLVSDQSEIPPEENLVLRAARGLRQSLGERRGARIRLVKRIPLAAGLGGGSSDAAATLIGLCRLWRRDIPVAGLAAIAAGLGSDVPYFLYGGTALAEGRGERVTPLPPMPESWLVLATPPTAVPGKTGKLYRALAPSAFTQGEATRSLVRAIRSGEAVTPSRLHNVFESVAGRVFPELDRYRGAFRAAGAPVVHLSGSGPTVFVLFSSPAQAAELRARLDAAGVPALVVKTVASPYNRN